MAKEVMQYGAHCDTVHGVIDVLLAKSDFVLECWEPAEEVGPDDLLGAFFMLIHPCAQRKGMMWAHILTVRQVVSYRGTRSWSKKPSDSTSVAIALKQSCFRRASLTNGPIDCEEVLLIESSDE
jgi:hypothetical protein